MGAGESALYLNGIPMDMEVYDIFSLLDIMRSEAKIMEGLFSLGLKVSLFFFQVFSVCCCDSSNSILAIFRE